MTKNSPAISHFPVNAQNPAIELTATTKDKLNVMPLVSPIVKFSIVIFFLKFGDGLMSYATPLFLHQKTNDTFLMGLIISMSSFFGLFFDFWIDETLWRKSYKFFLKMAFICAIGFPLTFLILPTKIVPVLIAMALWSGYWEFMGYSKYHFIHKNLTKEKHALGWSIIGSYSALAFLIAPLVATYLLDLGGVKTSFMAALIIFLIGYFALGILIGGDKNHQKPFHNIEHPRRNFKKQFEILLVLAKSSWPLFVFGLLLEMTDAFFWTVGILLSEQLRANNVWGSFFMSAYSLPTIFAGLIAAKVHILDGKKHFSFLAAIVAGAMLVFMGVQKNVPLVLLAVLLFSAVFSIAIILYYAVIEDFVARLGKFANDMATLEQLIKNVSYVIGPILAGFLASRGSNQLTFIEMGIALIIMSLICLALVPKKIHMPEKLLNQIENVKV